jgi:hypothetical protein
MGLTHFAVAIVTVFSLYVGMALLGFGLGKKIFRWLEHRASFLSRIVLVIGLLLLTLLIAASFGNQWVMTHYAEHLDKLICHQCSRYFGGFPAELRYAAFYLGWWLMWTPIAGPYIAKISQGRTIREMILGLCAVPTLVVGILLWKPLDPSQLMGIVQVVREPWALLILGLGVILVLWRLLSKVNRLSWFYCGDFVPSEGSRSRLLLNDGPKTKGMTLFYQRIGTTTIAILVLHTVIGWIGVQFQLTAIGLLVMIVMSMGLCFFVGQLIRDKVLIGKENIPEITP